MPVHMIIITRGSTMRVLIITSLLICVICNNLIFAKLNKYPTYDEYLEMMEKFQTEYPELCEIEEMGESVIGRMLLSIKISDNALEDEAEPEFLFTSTMEGDELTGYVLSLRLIDYLLSNYQKDVFVKKLVDNIEIWICPLLNPDGTFKGGNDNIEAAVSNNANGVSLKRTFPVLPGTGNSLNPEKETMAIMDFVEKHNFTMSCTFNSGLECCAYPWYYTPKLCTDNKWFVSVTRGYADTTQEYGVPEYFDDSKNGITDGYNYVGYGVVPWYNEWLFYFQGCRDIIVELFKDKAPQEDQLSNYWDYNYRSIINYLEQVLFGVKGTVTDSLTGAPIEAKVFIENFDTLNSHVYSHLPHGDYYRPISEGTYDITFSSEGYHSKTIKNVKAVNNSATILDVQLRDMANSISTGLKRKPAISIQMVNGRMKFFYNILHNNYSKDIEISIFDISGRLVRLYSKELCHGKNTIVWDGFDNGGNSVSKGCYIVRIGYNKKSITTRFIYP